MQCDVLCFWPNRRAAVISKVDISGATMLISMEGEGYYPELSLRNRDTHHAIASTRFDSDVPMPYFSWNEYAIQSDSVPFDHVIASATSFVASNCHSLSGREKMVRELMSHLRVDSYGRCLNNMNRRGHATKAGIIRQYATHLAFENQCVDDYITEKLWGVLGDGVIPVYYGAPNIAMHVPKSSIVDARKFPDMSSLALHLDAISNNRTLYDSYHAWRRRPLPQWFVRKYNFTHVHSECRICRWGFARANELVWNAATQTVESSPLA